MCVGGVGVGMRGCMYQCSCALQCANEKNAECAQELQMLKLEMMGEAAGQRGNSLFSEVNFCNTPLPNNPCSCPLCVNTENTCHR